MTRRALPGLALPLCGLLAASACASHHTAFLDRAADFDAIRRVAVLPFENLTTDPNAGEKVRRIFIIELLSQEVVEVVDPGEVARVLSEQRIDAVDTLGPEQVKALAEAMQAHALILGTVQEFSVDRTGQVSAPQVSLTCRMLEADSGRTLWSAAVSRGGAGAMSRLFGVSGDTPSEATRKLVREAIETLVD